MLFPNMKKPTIGQAVIYSALAIYTGVALWPAVASTPKPLSAPTPTGKGEGGTSPATTAASPGARQPLVEEVAQEAERLKKDQPAGWSYTAGVNAGRLRDVLPVEAHEFQGQDVTRYRQAAFAGWKWVEGAGAPDVPTFAGAYRCGRVAASDWPRPGTTAVELFPLGKTDPDARPMPWRVVLLLTTGQTAGYRQAAAERGGADQLVLGGRTSGGHAGIPAVPVDRVERDGGITYYCVSPVATVFDQQLYGLNVQQTSDTSAAARWTEWREAYEAALAGFKQRAGNATTAEERAAIQGEIQAWQRNHPEPPKAGATTAAR